MADVLGFDRLDYDADGMGALVRGDARVLNEKRKHEIAVHAWRGSGAVVDKDKPIKTAAPRGEKRDPNRVERLNGDYYHNAKAQGWFELRVRAQCTVRALEMQERGEDWRTAYGEDDLLSLDSRMPELALVTQQLSQPTYTQSTAGKMIIDKAPDGQRSPNHGDAIMIRFAPRKAGLRYNLGAFAT
jgi:phage terminase large subunit